MIHHACEDDSLWIETTGVSVRAKLAQFLYDLNYTPSRADPDVWMRPAVQGGGFKYYEYILCYFDDVLCISQFSLKTIDSIKAVFKLKREKTGTY